MATILVVDDHLTTRFLLKRVLQTAGHLVLEAPDGRAALAELGRHPEVALLVTDLEMPGMDGFALLRALSSRPELPKLIVSAAPTDVGGALGAAEVFRKPPDLTRFRGTVARLLGAPAPNP